MVYIIQVIVGEHEELPEAELNDAGMPDDPEVEDLLVNGNMEQLAALVLNGEGKRLLGRQSGNPDLQAFIDNVPSYIVCSLFIFTVFFQVKLKFCCGSRAKFTRSILRPKKET